MLGTRLATACSRSLRRAHPPAAAAAALLPRRQCSSAPPTAPADHRDLGVQQELFTTSVYSPGSPIFLPRGALIFNRLVDLLRRKYIKYGFDEVITPTIYKKALWARSGHLDNYADDMFTVTSTSPARRDSSPPGGAQQHEHVQDEYGLKPMNCPGHCLIFNARRHSYRDLPIRYADFSPLHRNEVSGALSGLTRVRRFHQDDGHIFCRPAQIEAEIAATLAFVRETYDLLGLGPYRLVLSTRPDEHYIGTAAEWDQAEAALRRALDAAGQGWTLNAGDGAFYGPKIDIILRDSDGKEHQTATVQLDFQLPKRFGLEYEAPAPDAESRGLAATDPAELAVVGRVAPVMIHRAVLGSVERLMALLIEHYNGKWPFWLSPRQVMVITVNDTADVLRLARDTRTRLQGVAPADEPSTTMAPAPALAVDLDDSARSVGLKVREARSKGYGVLVTVGPRNVQSGEVDVDATGVPNFVTDSSQKIQSMSPSSLLASLRQHAASYR